MGSAEANAASLVRGAECLLEAHTGNLPASGS